jgi:hypothetical protein
MTISNHTVNKVFNDLDQFRDYCRFEGKVFNEADLYKKEAPVWIAYQKYQGWIRAKARNAGKPFTPKPRPDNRSR